MIRSTLCLLCLAAFATAAERQPNVIVMLTDDQGTLDAGCYGATDLKTPHIDALAARGVRFTQFYAAAPLCSPSRAAMMTGRYPLRAGMPGNAPSERDKPGMPPEEVTMAEMLRAAGYGTAHIGKWHLGYTPETMPNGQGFDYSFGHMGGCIDNWSHFFYWQGPNRHDLHRDGKEIFEDGQFFMDMMVNEATAFMKRTGDRPWFIYFAINAPHYPYQGSKEWVRYYRERGVPYPRDLYNAFVSTMDEKIGKLLAAIDTLRQRENTIVVFQSDHGHSTEERAHFGGGFAGPYRGAKGGMFEGGLRVPAIISWPGRLPQNQVRGQLAHGCDWFPTVAELTGAKLLQSQLDGKSLVRVIKSADAPTAHETLHWHLGRGANAQWAVRQGPWKLMGNTRDPSNKAQLSEADQQLFLANLEQDPGEMTNFAAMQPDVLKRLKASHEEAMVKMAPATRGRK
jgi:arylsulfatase A